MSDARFFLKHGIRWLLSTAALVACVGGAAFVLAAVFGEALTQESVGMWILGLGVLCVILGIFSIGGTRATARGFSAQMAQTLDADTPGDRSRRAGAEMVLQFGWPLRLVSAGGLAVVIGTLLGA